jgi:hypothetical protein
MRKLKRKHCLVCLLGILLLLPVGSMPVRSETLSSGEAVTVTESEETVLQTEKEETVSVTLEEVQQYMQLLGESDGYMVYLRNDNSQEEIPDHFETAALVIAEAATGEPIAELEEFSGNDDEHIYLSQTCRFLVCLNGDRTAVSGIRFRVSTLDSAYLFLTADKETLELYSTDYTQVRATMTVAETTEEQCIYRSDDGVYQAFLSADRKEAWSCVRLAAENERLALYVDDDTAVLALENKENGFIWWSSPLNANRDTEAAEVKTAELQSSMVLTYGDTDSFTVTNLRSRSAASVQVTDLENGVKITYRYEKCGITVPVSYTLCEDYLSVSVECDEIEESMADEGKKATQLTLLGSFGAASSQEDGYFVLPDGCGALVYFNNGKENAKSYSQPVYGRDITDVPVVKPAVTEEIYMPVYGIVREDNAMAVVIAEGDGNATLNCSVSGQSLSSYNLCSFSFRLRGSDTYLMAGNDGSSLTVFESGDIKTERITLRYYPIAKQGADYTDVANTYRSYLLGDGGVTAKASSDTASLYLSLYGGTMKSRSILGIPVSVKNAVTGYDEAQEIVSSLVDAGVDDMVVIYNAWTDAGISGKVDMLAGASGTLGGYNDFQELTEYLEEQNIAFYPAVNNKTFSSGGGYNTYRDTAIRISGSYSRQLTYSYPYGVQDTSVKTRALLSPDCFTEIYRNIASRYAQKGLTGVSLGEMTSTLWGDYGKKSMSRDDTEAVLKNSYADIADAGLSLLADGCAAYAFPYADRISSVPLQSSGFDLFDADIPFYQLVMHGILPLAGTAINGSTDINDAFLKCIAAGCNPSFDMIYAEADDLKDTELDVYYYAHYAYWTDTAAAQYRLADKILSTVSDCTITAYVREGDISVTTYDNGTEITVDYETETITVNGTVYTLTDTEGEAAGY